MAEKKKSSSNSNKSKSTGRSPAVSKKEELGSDIIQSTDHHSGGKKKAMKLPRNPDSPGSQILLCVIGLVGLLLLLCLFITDMELKGEGLTGPVGYAVSLFFYGVLGIGAYIVPVMILIYAAMWKSSVRKGKTLSKAVLSSVLTVIVSAMIHMAFVSFGKSGLDSVAFYNVAKLWESGIALRSGGVLGGFIGGLMKSCLNVVAWPVLSLAAIGVTMFIFELTPNMIAYFIRQLARKSSDNRRIKKQQRRGEKAEKAEQRRIKRDQAQEEREQRRLEKEREIAEREEKFYREHSGGRQVTDIQIEDTEPKPPRTRKPVEEQGVKEREQENTSEIQDVYVVEEVPVKEDKPEEDIMIIRRGKIRSESDRRPKGEEKPSEPTVRTVKDVDINSVFDEKVRSDSFGFSGSTDLDGNERFAAQGDEENCEFELYGGKEQQSGETDAGMADENEIDDFLDTLEDVPVIGQNDEIKEIKESEPEKVSVKATREKLIPEFDDDVDFEEEAEEAKPAYTLPPITLLDGSDEPMASGFSDEVLERNGKRLVDTLKSFRVDVDIAHISKGPTITRYELVPKAGVRVRSIANLVDDIALALETSGIRIEAPIPGKAAVGIEVPNKNLSTVYLRSLIDTDAFRNAKSRLNCCLGKNVSGDPVYLDIAKMPHLLIAGATGMGKSVCINSLLISLLYKATPDEVKLILIDPKKVELNVYNKLPHLLVPVVNQPKMAAGSLAWAVGEMERRFELIEEVGVRDIAGYNKVTANDPQKEFLPQIVIIIDELADLMMTAPVDVEASIIRLAQKARAAGMHLIIGTQRPSVDVITGLIKANVPSRIAFTVASNIDSRTIIDVAGAEKLIGRGDMLYAPVGAMKPIRVQGSFVSDSEVERVTEFIKAQIKGDYDEQIIKEIDKNAKQCGQKKKAEAEPESSGAGADLDEKFYEAVDVALEEGKVSTSLLQRRISVGYGRAAKIIDTMQQMRIVSPPDGQKPRNTLITRQDWDEMMMRMDNSSSGASASSDANRTSLGEDEFDDDAPF